MVVIESDIPGDVMEFAYAKNHHYLKLRDGEGRETLLIEHGLIRYRCESCECVFFMVSNVASACPSCGSRHLAQQWMRPQVSLVPEDESNFEMVPPGD